ncbi:MAG: 5-(carboxyamino)imidazole ribonucleotide mutase [Candidatus Thalassarchaeaceae archaeon]|jgi:5-(carboxyamino)imidazole ribonucleotide mutase|nr:5-(carboxyamino)imidazole ribonucleotide mutase [Euryarchaeota archaeon]MDP6220367.1 5-(carboxyamino)imidazole ribonucleotide mutase [Candidatus Thalassarchaeaceae archaeon]MBV43185.1 5-(carboxyamino)imidazole ribonucleotide mutase [Euryarchaeota archaeon]MDP7092138.1 5-(carboxyamino)imidazole ribonucleotide mutase [Candidatus Thalassarchaeaceae archaeon]MDP7257331.1 5-(carboxyamino)imidazole ribonucleotide mutase [Candidatus Thalassarchaeaceae archaeon]|tara:strand:- start:984 stop:1457 length:474 start_codon:yes stop_codon:yes gene_type:complete
MDVCVVMGSKSDIPVCDKCTSILEEFDIDHEVRVASAHRAPRYLEEVVSTAIGEGCKIFIGIAGLSAALPGVIASMTSLPVIGVPVGGKVPLDSLLSVIQMPPGVPVAAVGVDRGDNAAVLAAQMLAMDDGGLAQRVVDWRAARTDGVIADDESLRR